MKKYMPLIRFETEFQGDSVVAELEPLDRGTLLTLQNIDRTDELTVYNSAVEVLSKFLKKIDGVKDGNGNAVSMQTVLDKVFFMTLVNEMFAKLVTETQLGEAQAASEAK